MPPLPQTEILEPFDAKDFEENPNVLQDYLKICEYLNDLKCGEGIDFENVLKEIGMVYETYFPTEVKFEISKSVLKKNSYRDTHQFLQ